MATREQVLQLHRDLLSHFNKDPHADRSDTQRNLVKGLAEALIAANPNNAAAKAVLAELAKGSLLISDGVALVGQLVASFGSEPDVGRGLPSTLKVKRGSR